MPERIPQGPILELRLNRPPANALDLDTMQELILQLREAPRQDFRAIVLSGTPRMFCAGLDVPFLQTLDKEAMSRFWASFFELLRTLAQCRLPLVAAVTGHAPAGGTVLAAFCDYRVMAEGDFKMGFNEVRVGLPVPYPIYVAFERLCGTRLAARYSTEGKILDSRHALEIGLVDELAPVNDVVSQAYEWAKKVAALPPNAVARTREFARRSLIQAFEGWATDPDEMTRFWQGEEAQGAIRRLLEQIRK